MNCRNCTSMLSAHRDGRLGDADTANIERHLDTCAACSRAARLMRVTGEVLVAEGPAMPAEDLAARAARNALTEQPDEDASGLWNWWMRVAAPATALGAAAAVILVLLGGSPPAAPGESASELDPIGVIGDTDDGELDATMLAMGDD